MSTKAGSAQLPTPPGAMKLSWLAALWVHTPTRGTPDPFRCRSRVRECLCAHTSEALSQRCPVAHLLLPICCLIFSSPDGDFKRKLFVNRKASLAHPGRGCFWEDLVWAAISCRESQGNEAGQGLLLEPSSDAESRSTPKAMSCMACSSDLGGSFPFGSG